MNDPVKHPKHYTDTKIETFDFIKDKGFSYCLGQVVKYVSRAGKKGDRLEDLLKAEWYLQREIEIEEEKRGEETVLRS